NILEWRLKLEAIGRLRAVRIIRLLIVAEDVREAVVLSFLNVIKFLRMVGHGTMLGIDQPTLIVPIEAKGIAIAARENLRRLLALGGIKAQDSGRELTTGKVGSAGHIRMRSFTEPA